MVNYKDLLKDIIKQNVTLGFDVILNAFFSGYHTFIIRGLIVMAFM